MGYRWEHPPYGGIACKLDEHGGDREERDDQLYEKLEAEISEALSTIAAKPEYASIISWTDFPGAPCTQDAKLAS